jgi:two-component system sensor histidine kinase DegS
MSAQGLRDELIAEIQAEYDAIKNRIKENQALADQSQVEVQRLQERNVAVNARMRRIEDAFDTVPRQDIRVTYEDAIDAKSRLLTMRAQLEKLQEGQQQLDNQGQILARLLEKLKSAGQFGLGGYSPSGSGGGTPKATLSLDGQAIVRVVQAQEQERQALANKLHDGPAQSLTNFILQAEVCQRLFDRDPDRASQELTNLKAAASQSFQKVRDFIFDLRPMMLDDLGLIPTLRRYAENFEQKSETKLQFNVVGEERRMAKHTEVMMFRSIQSLLSICRDQLSAKTIRLMLDVGTDTIKAVVEDDGQGFDVETVFNASLGDARVQGLNALNERIELVGGKLDIYSEEGSGSRFQLILPIFEDEEPDLNYN